MLSEERDFDRRSAQSDVLKAKLEVKEQAQLAEGLRRQVDKLKREGMRSTRQAERDKREIQLLNAEIERLNGEVQRFFQTGVRDFIGIIEKARKKSEQEVERITSSLSPKGVVPASASVH
ncbi:hypothetical protein DIPPA_09124 [Diplonema papillatum]|nr:hypothetical protein DIPPA_09124 [Diplonema papillatum]